MSIAPPPMHAPVEAPDAAAYRAPATDVLAIVAICASAAGVTLMPLLGSIAGIVLGAIALPRIRRANTGGRPLAIAAIALGGAGLVLGIAGIVVAVMGFGHLVASMPGI